MYNPCSENKGADQLRAVTAKLICVFVFGYADCLFSHEAAHIFCKLITFVTLSLQKLARAIYIFFQKQNIEIFIGKI